MLFRRCPVRSACMFGASRFVWEIKIERQKRRDQLPRSGQKEGSHGLCQARVPRPIFLRGDRCIPLYGHPSSSSGLMITSSGPSHKSHLSIEGQSIAGHETPPYEKARKGLPSSLFLENTVESYVTFLEVPSCIQYMSPPLLLQSHLQDSASSKRI